MTPPLRTDELLLQTRWLQRLAHTLVADVDLAEDAVQDVMLVALQRRPALTDLRAWLGTVLRHRMLRLRRRERRRAELEIASRCSAEAPPTDEVVAQAELHRAVADAVIGLPEPYRTTILLRYLQEMTPAAIAQRLRLPVETVRTRCKRALEMLRQRLDLRCGGRSAWAVVAAALPLATPAFLMSTKLVLGGLAAAAVVAAFILFAHDPGPRGAVRPSANAAPPPAVAAALPAPKVITTRTKVDPPALAAPRAAPARARVRGQVVDEATRRPLPGAVLAWAALDGDRPTMTSTATTDADGRFVLDSTEPAPHEHYELIVRAADHALCNQALGNPTRADAAALEFDVGTITVPPGTGIAGRVVDQQGKPVGDADLLLCLRWYWGEDGRRRTLPAQALVVGRSRADGTFELRDRVLPVSGAPLLLAACERGLGWCELEQVQRDRRDVADVSIALQPVAALRVVVRDPQGKPIAGAVVTAEPRFVPLGSDQDWPSHVQRVPALCRALQSETGSDGVALLAALPAATPLPFTLRTVATGFEPAAQRVVATMGHALDVALELTSPVRYAAVGTVSDAAGLPIEGACVRAEYGAHATVLTDALGRFRAGNLARGDGPMTVSVHAAGRTSAQARRAPAPGERELEFAFTLSRAKVLLGRCIDQHGAAVPGAELWIEGGAAQSITSDARGEFRFDDVAIDGPKVLRVQPPNDHVFAARTALEIEPGRAEVTVVLDRLPRGNATLHAELLDAAGRPLEPKGIRLERRAVHDSLWHPATGRIGEITAQDLAPGRWRLIVTPTRGHELAAELTITDPAAQVELRLQQQAPGTVRGELALPPDAASAPVVLQFLGAATARWQPQAEQQAGPGGHTMLAQAADGASFVLVDADPSRPLTIAVLEGDLVGSVTVQPRAGFETRAMLRLQRTGALAFTCAGGWPQDCIALQLRHPGMAWPEPESFEGLRGKTAPLRWPVAPGEWEWRIEGLAADGLAQVPLASGTAVVPAGDTAGVAVVFGR